ncbi:hypothetical protein Q3G72_003394 [Acer saccharum]|nr:hypothetical protein Q3G72_003394 [Acer saccharum]
MVLLMSRLWISARNHLALQLSYCQVMLSQPSRGLLTKSTLNMSRYDLRILIRSLLLLLDMTSRCTTTACNWI